jgi:hypothetical protein
MRDEESGQQTGAGADHDDVTCSSQRDGFAFDLSSVVLVLMALARLLL